MKLGIRQLGVGLLVCSLQGCGGGGGDGAPPGADPASPSAPSAPSVPDSTAGCGGWQDVQALSAQLDFNYAWAGMNGPIALRLDQSARASGTLLRVPAQLPFLKWRGKLDQGIVTVADRSELSSGKHSVVTTLSGAGDPFTGPGDAGDPGMSAVTVVVNLLECNVSFGGDIYVGATETTQGIPSATPSQAGGGFAYDVRPIGGRREFVDTALVPAVGTLASGDRYVPHGLGSSLVIETAGHAELHWAFRPVP